MAQHFFPLGDIVGGSSSSSARGISADGHTIVGFGTSEVGTEAVAWIDFQLVRLGGLGDGSTFHSDAAAVSAQGDSVVGQSLGKLRSGKNPSSAYPIYWNVKSRKLSVLPDLSNSHVGGTVPTAISADGQIVAGASGISTLGPQQAFVWTSKDGIRQIGFLDGATELRSVVCGMSADGRYMVGDGTNAAGARQAFLYSAANGIAGLEPLKSNEWCYATAISSDGQVVVGGSGVVPVLWTKKSGCEEIGLLRGTRGGTATAVSGDGSVIIGQCDSTAFVWDRKNGIRDLRAVVMAAEPSPSPIRNWQLVMASGISEDGTRIVGEALDASRQTEAYLIIF